MFEYAALVDAPVQRFTGIVTGPDPLDDDVAPAPSNIGAPSTIAAAPEPMLVEAAPARSLPAEAMPAEVAAAPAPIIFAAAPSESPAPAVSPKPESPVAHPVALPALQPKPRVVDARPATREPSFMPALLAVAAAGLTAMWWLRRDSHDR